MSPILVRPVREQLEHDRVIRLLQAKYKRKFDVAINPGNEQTAGVGPGPAPWYPDLVLQTSDRGRKLAGVVEVETAESVNNLEAMSQWATFARLRVPFHLYLPTSSVDVARRFCADMSIAVAELWAYQSVGDQLRFTLVHRSVPVDGRGRSEDVEEAPPRATPRAARPAARKAPPAGEPARARRTVPASARRPAARRAAPPATRGAAKKAKASAVRRPAAKAPVRKAVKRTAAPRRQKRR